MGEKKFVKKEGEIRLQAYFMFAVASFNNNLHDECFAKSGWPPEKAALVFLQVGVLITISNLRIHWESAQKIIVLCFVLRWIANVTFIFIMK